MTDAQSSTVRDNQTRRRYELDVPGGQAFIDYRRDAGVVTMAHAEVPPELQGRGIGSVLVKGALDLARGQGEHVIAACPFVAAYLRRHPEYRDLLAAPV
ncbi:MAG: GNAT family N-acetyltransferase [Steroidobacteraceae bacterium]